MDARRRLRVRGVPNLLRDGAEYSVAEIGTMRFGRAGYFSQAPFRPFAVGSISSAYLRAC
jgi:hypothetical protein